MKKLLLPVCLIFWLLFSCQSEEVLSENGQSVGRKSNAFAKAELSESANANSPDPTYIEPQDPGSGGGAGGDVGSILPVSPVTYSGSPYILPGRTGALFTSSGSIDGDIMGFGPLNPNLPRPLMIVPSALGVLMGFTFVYGGARYLVQGYSVTIYNGQVHYWMDTMPIQLVVGSAAIGQPLTYFPDVWDQGHLAVAGHWDCTNCGAAGTLQGQLKVTDLSMNAEGKITLKGSVILADKTIQINIVNWRRWW